MGAEFGWHQHEAPPPEWQDHRKAVLNGALLRESHHTRGGLDPAANLMRENDEAAFASLTFCNGPLNRSVVSRYEIGCGHCNTKEELEVAEVVAV